MKIKKFEEFDKINEGIGLTILSTFAILVRSLIIYKTYKTNLPDSSIDIEMTQEISEIVGFRCPEVYSLRKDKEKSPIACATINKIYYDKVLKEQLTHRELIAVLLHELSHVKSQDIAKKQILWLFPFIPIVLLDSWFLYFLLPMVTNLVFSGPYSRYAEYKSDSFAAKYGYGEDLSSALVKVGHYFKKKSKNSIDKELRRESAILKKIVQLLSTHPTLVQRVKKLYNKENPEDFIKKIEGQVKDNERNDLSMFR